MRSTLYLSQAHWMEMLHDVKSRKIEEACGLVAGERMTSVKVFPVTNELHSPLRYRLDPQEQLEVLINLEENNWDLLAIYHSHLRGPDQPSATDVAEAMYPGVIHLIWFPHGDEWTCRGFLIEPGEINEVQIVIGKNPQLSPPG